MLLLDYREEAITNSACLIYKEGELQRVNQAVAVLTKEMGTSASS